MPSGLNNQITEHLVIVTGASKGLGYALAKAFLAEYTAKKKIFVVTIARSQSIDLQLENNENINTVHFSADLGSSESTKTLINKIDAFISTRKSMTQLTLINNAGTVEPMGLLNERLDDHQFSKAFELNVISPIRLAKWVIQNSKVEDKNKKILNISSGAGRKAVPGWGIYCATKAALDRFSEVIALEKPDILISSLAPGVIDTQMQQTIRDTPESQFPTLNRFTELHNHGELADPKITAAKIVRFLSSEQFGQTVLDDIRLHSL